ncbi:CRISPR-associated helicase Cas3 [Leptospira kirschneri str. H2]|uniref:CRISPR-associated helicase/endonuclease Cas3 n=1 Tax=Leptospira kirschneri TaxID=29507 RepID=UPI000292738F|nr:CRISPR-associated helicase/endonuclease Cas3 [Leptospira kirschneri]EKO59403.1 CRISPR-associated helicase Cas3 [Leptospira kirschneri str. H2]
MTKDKQSIFIAHVLRKDDGSFVEHLIDDHLYSVAEFAKKFCEKFGAETFGYLIGLWHDLGKFKLEFQERIRIRSGHIGEEAHLEGKTAKSVKHSVSGAIHCLNKFKQSDIIKKLICLPILCHHSGLKNFGIDVDIQLNDEKEISALSETITYIPQQILDGIELKQLGKSFKDHSLLIRMLFSSLIDADRLDTERFMDLVKFKERYSKTIILQDLNIKLDKHLNDIQKQADATKVNSIRKRILEEVQSKTNLKPGFYTLTVPTGGGKTLTSLSFALKHCITNKMDRVIYGVPYLSIIEQTADVFKKILGEDSVLEHHSGIDISKEKENSINRLLTENWDHPLIVTTNVQFFESLFSSKTTKVRKLHNIINSVIILDEAQMIPPQFLQPIVKTLKELVEYYNVKIILCTATQPTLSSIKSTDLNFDGIDTAIELAPEPEKLFQELKRVIIHKPEEKKLSFMEVATRILNYDQVLTIVNRKSDASGIFNQLTGNKYYLTTNLCAEHRRDILKKVKNHLNNGESVYLVSTQLIEAGVDIDFPIVFRAVAGLDSIAQAAGRCNREGKLLDENGQEKLGEVFLFKPEQDPPAGHLLQTEQASRDCIKNFEELIHPDTLKQYFNTLFWLKQDKGLDKEEIEKDKRSFQFETINKNFKLIDEDSRPVIVPYKEGKDLIVQLQNSVIQNNFLDYKLIRKSQRYTVNLKTNLYNKLLSERIISEIEGIIGILTFDSYYHNDLGILESPNEQDLII